jgi:hypothetical protein
MLINNNLEKYIHKFPNILFEHSLRLNDITGKNVSVLNDEQILECNEAFPNKFELEVVRFWRKKNLLPFFEEGKHAKISLAQLMWLRFLESLRNLSPNISVLEGAFDFFLKSAFDNNIAFRSLIELELKLKTDILKNPDDSDLVELLKTVTEVLKKQILQDSLRTDLNYFNMYVMDEIINAPNSNIIFTYKMVKEFNTQSNSFIEKPKFEVIKNGRVVSKLGEENENDKLFDLQKLPIAVFYAKYFLEDIFADCNISAKAFNIQILDSKEQSLFEEIRNENLINVTIQSLSKEIGEIQIEIMNSDGSYNIEGIKKLKLTLGTKHYRSGIGTLKNGIKYSF